MDGLSPNQLKGVHMIDIQSVEKLLTLNILLYDFPRNIYQIRETLFDKLDSFGIMYTSQQKLFKNLPIFDFESICVQEESFKDTKTITWI